MLDLEGRVHPYPRPLSIRGADGGGAGERHVAELGGVAGEQSAEVAMIVVTRYRAGADWKPAPLSGGQATVQLLANTFPAQGRPKESLTALRHATAGAITLHSDRGEADPIARELLGMLSSAEPSPAGHSSY